MDSAKEGKIIVWRKYFGFIEVESNKDNIFFPKKSLSYSNVALFDHVTFETIPSINPQHIGSPVASNIKFLRKGNPKDYKLHIGKIKNKKKNWYYIEDPKLIGQEIIFVPTRLLYTNKIKVGDLIIYHPIKSSKNPDQLFGFFGYPVSFEQDINFLVSKLEENQIPELRNYILNLKNRQTVLPPEKNFFLELDSIGLVDNSKKYSKLISLVNKYKSSDLYIPRWNTLENYVENPYLILLWINEFISTYNYDLIEKYFFNANADEKREITRKLAENDRENLLKKYSDYLERNNKFSALNNELKTLLDIIHRINESRFDELYKEVKIKLLENLSPKEIIDLWLHQYLSDLSDAFIVNNINPSDLKLLKKIFETKDNHNSNPYKNLIQKIFNDYFNEYAQKDDIDFDADLPKLISYLKACEDFFLDEYEKIKNRLYAVLKSHQVLILKIFGVDIEHKGDLQHNVNKLNPYFRLKFKLDQALRNEFRNNVGGIEQITVSESDLIQFSSNYKWNELIYPTRILNERNIHSFLYDVDSFNQKYNSHISSNILAENIYNKSPKYSEIHLRLWLYFFSNRDNYEDFYDYVGFRESFKNLNSAEKKLFAKKGNNIEIKEIIEVEMAEVTPCKNFKEEKYIKIYTATLENLYFIFGSFKLRMEGGDYTQSYQHEFCTSGLNRIPNYHTLNKIEINITVQGNEIIKVNGLQELFTKIHIYNISKSLEGHRTADYSDEFEITYGYIEDWELRKQIIDYLTDNNSKKYEPIQLTEKPSFYRHYSLTDKDKVDGETSEIFTIELENDYGIIWEFTDFTEDKATYIFKVTQETYIEQIAKLKRTITSVGRLRYTLSHQTENDRMLTHFRNNLGYIANIRKSRGKANAFKIWEEKLISFLNASIPDIPSKEIQEQLEGWTLDRVDKTIKTRIFKSQKSRNTVTQVDTATLNVTDMDFTEQPNSTIKSKDLKALEKLNEFLEQNLKA